jgi:hypothetical protein
MLKTKALLKLTALPTLLLAVTCLTGCHPASPDGKQLFVEYWNGRSLVMAPVNDYTTVLQKITDAKVGTFDFVWGKVIKRNSSGVLAEFHRTSMGADYATFDQDLTVFFPYGKPSGTLFFETSPIIGIYRKDIEDLPLDPREAAQLFWRDQQKTDR